MRMSPYRQKIISGLINYIFPILTLTFLSQERYLGGANATLLAIAFPICYGVYALFDKQRPIHSVTGSLVVIATGVVLLLGGGKTALIAKEVIIPTTFSLVCLVLILFKHPLIDIFWKYTFNHQKLKTWFAKKSKSARYNKYQYAGRFLLLISGLISAGIQLGLGIWLISGEAGSAELIQSAGVFQAISIPVVIISNFTVLVGGYALLAVLMSKDLGCNFTRVFR